MSVVETIEPVGMGKASDRLQHGDPEALHGAGGEAPPGGPLPAQVRHLLDEFFTLAAEIEKDLMLSGVYAPSHSIAVIPVCMSLLSCGFVLLGELQPGNASGHSSSMPSQAGAIAFFRRIFVGKAGGGERLNIF